uniref:BFN domain-containing protein n=1 Tax=Chenopodium quinoa TaxID=63459 RepID=A0A803LKJ4_CHEQI
MGSLHGPVVCPTIRAKQVGVYQTPISVSLMKDAMFRSAFWGYKSVRQQSTNASMLTRPINIRRFGTVHCTFSSSSNGSGNRAEKENDEDYVNSSVIEAVEVKSGSDGFTIKMRDGRFLKCVHNSPQGGHLPDYAPHPAIVLKMEDGTDLLLPIIVLEMPSVLLMAAIRNVHIARPTMYQIMKEMIEKMGYVVDNEDECISFDLRPSDAINIAVRCKVPIQVNRNLAQSDGMKIVESPKTINVGLASDVMSFTELDRPNGQPCIETTEFNLLRNMLNAACEERYQEAAQWRDKLTQLRAKRNWA